MSGDIVLTGLSSNDPVPGAYLEINFAQGEAAGSGSDSEVLLMGNKLSGGTATLDTAVYGPDSVVQMQTESDVISLFGAGSELHRMWRRFVKVNKSTTLRAIAVTESSGSKATGTITIATTATGNGNVRVWVHDEFVDASVTTGDTASNIGDAIAAAVNSQVHWGVTAGNSSGTVTLTAKQKGLRGNFIRYMAIITAGIATTASPGVDTAMSSGSSSDSNTTALSTIGGTKYYYIVSAAEDTTQLGAVVSQVGTLAAPIVGIRQRVVAGAVGSVSASNAVAVARNSARCDIQWSEGSPWTPAELAANLAAVVTLFETKPSPRVNYASFGQDAKTAPFWLAPAPRDASKIPSRASIKSALNNGLSPIGVLANGSTYLVDVITTRSLNGATNDYRVRDHHKVTICDFFGDDLLVKTVLQHSGKAIANDPVKGQRAPGPTVLTPTIMRGTIIGLIDVYDTNDLLQNASDIKAGLVVQRATSPTTRMTARIPLQPIDACKQFAFSLDQVA